MAKRAELERLIGIMEAKLAALPVLAPTCATTDWKQRRDEAADYHRAAEAALAELSAEGGKVRDAGNEIKLRLGGFSASCTHSAAGVMHNWLDGAKRRLAKTDGAAS